MLPPIELTHMTTSSSDSADSSLLDLQHPCFHAYNFEFPLKGLAT